MSRICPMLISLWLAAVSLPAQVPEPQPIGKTNPAETIPVVVREKTVYVPYNQLKNVFEKEGRGIFLPYEEFLKLWRAANPDPDPVKPDAPPTAAVIQSSPYKGKVVGDLALFEVSYHVEALKKGWSLIKLPLSGVAVESVNLGDSKALFSAQGNAYGLLLPEKGIYDIDLKFSVKVQSSPGKKTLSFGLPPVGIASLELEIPETDARVEVDPKTAATRVVEAADKTRVVTFVGNSSRVTISWMPPAGLAAEDAAVLIAKQYARAFLGERILSIDSTIQYELARGQVSGFKLTVPTADNTRLLYVKGENIRRWDLEGDILTVDLHSPIKKTYSLALGFERILPETPEAISVPIPKMDGVLRESGWLALAHDPALKVNISNSQGYSQLDPDEVPKTIAADLRVGFQYLAPPAPLGLAVRKIEPVIHSDTTSVVTLDRERDTWVGIVKYRIKKAGVFTVELVAPERWTVEEVGNPADVEDFQVSEPADGSRTITVNLRTRQLGEFKLPFKLSSEGSIGKQAITLSPLLVSGTQQDMGLFGVAAPRSIDIKTVKTTGLSSVEQQELVSAGIMSQVSAEAGEPLAYRYSKNSATERAELDLELKEKQEEINVISQHLVSVGESGRIKLTHYLDYVILYKERDTLEFSAPSSLDGELRVDGEGIAETPQPEAQGDNLSRWTVKLQSPVEGTVTLSITHEIPPTKLESGTPTPIEIPLVYPRRNFKTRSGFVAITKVGDLEVQPNPGNLDLIDASRLDPRIGRRGQVIKAYAYTTKDPSLQVTLTRFKRVALAETAIKLHHIKAVLSQNPRKIHAIATLLVQNSGAQHLEISRPTGATLKNVSVNGKPVTLRRRPDGETDLIDIPRSSGRKAFPVVIDYDQDLSTEPSEGASAGSPDSAMGSLGSIELSTIEVVDSSDKPVPVQKIEFDLWVPEEFIYLSWSGNLKRNQGRQTAISKIAKVLRSPFALGEGDAPHTAPAGGGIGSEESFKRETEGNRLYSFSSMASVGRLSLSWTTPAIFVFTEIVLFVAVLIGGAFLIRRFNLNRTWATFNLTWLPLVPAWFLEGPAAGPFTAAFCAGLVLMLGAGFAFLRQAFGQWRLERLALAPDPFLEDGPSQAEPEKAKPKKKARKASKKPSRKNKDS